MSNSITPGPQPQAETPQMPGSRSGYSPTVFGEVAFDQPFDPTLDIYSDHQDIGIGGLSQFTTNNPFGQLNYMMNNGVQQSSTANMQNPFQDSMGNGGGSSGYMGESSAFQQGFIPQDLWSMPMTFEWDWADLSSNMPFSS